MRWLLLILLALPLSAADLTIVISRPKPPDPRQFPIMAWSGLVSDPEILRGMKEAGFNIAGFCGPEILDKVRDAGLTCFVLDKRISLTREQWDKLPPEAELRKGIAELVRQVGNHPAALGYYLLDEPNASMLENLGHVAGILHEFAPDKLPYVNLFAMTASRRRFEPIGYERYLRGLAHTVPFISYDMYGLMNGQVSNRFYTNLEIVRRTAQEVRLPFWNVVASHASAQLMEPSDATLHLQAYATLAYGGRGIGWFLYLTPDVVNGEAFFRLAAVDAFGHRTATWGMLQRINFQLHALSSLMLGLRSTGVYHYPDVPEQAKPLTESAWVKGIEVPQEPDRPATGVLIGEFEDGRGRPYLMVVNKSLSNNFLLKMQLKQPERKIFVVSPYSVREIAFDPGMGWLAPGSGLLLRLE